MTRVAELRCTAPHPEIAGWTCRAKITDVIRGTVALYRKNGTIRPGCVTFKCRRCGTEYEACPVRVAI